MKPKLTTKKLAKELTYPNGKLLDASDQLVAGYSRLSAAHKWPVEREAAALMDMLKALEKAGFIRFVEE